MGWWTRGPVIGRGSSATVSLATTTSGELLAVKSTELSCSNSLQKERSIISQLSSPYIVKCVGCDISSENNKPVFNLLMEYVPGGTLSDQINNLGGSFEESMIQIYAHQILQGLDYLHLNGIVHCDIKGQNVLIGKDGAKIADLGCSRKVENGNGIAGKSIISGTPAFMAPEVARGEEQGFPADIWALGCTVIQMATGFNPWPNMDGPVSAMYRIGYSGDVPQFPSWLSNVAKDFLSKCLRRDGKERWTAKQLLQHEFFHGFVIREEEVEAVRNSPTSVLDQCFWDSMEAQESFQDSSNVVFSLSSPANRIKNLIGDLVSSNSIFPDWTEDGDWIAVRSTDTEEIHQISQHNQISIQDSQLAMEPFLASVVSEAELESSISMDDTLSNCLGDEITSNIGNFSSRTNLTLSIDEVGDAFDIVFRILDFEMMIMETSLLINSQILQSDTFFMFLLFEFVRGHVFHQILRQFFISLELVKSDGVDMPAKSTYIWPSL